MNNIMKKILLLLFAVAIFVPLKISAQTDEKLAAEFGGRLAFSMDKRITRGLHVNLEEEVRFDNNLGSFDRFQTTLLFNYKVHPNIKIGLGYSLINGYSSTSGAFKNARHRLIADVKGTLRFGLWNVSLKERFQMTHRTGDFNKYQNPANALTLKSRLMVTYNGYQRMKPYAYLELRHYFNAPTINATYNGTTYVTDDYSTTGEPGWFLSGFNSSYLNRYRVSLGMDYRLTRRSSINVYIIGDYCIDKVVDANAEGTKLKSYTKETGFKYWLGAGYQFAF